MHEFREPGLVAKVSRKIKQIAHDMGRQIQIMEVCGTHAMAILKFGIKQLLPANVKLISGPGCPVCVTPNQYLDVACTYARKGFLIATFGDMMRVPGSNGSLSKEKSQGGKIKVVYSALDALELAKSFPEEKVVFLGIGFETTIPTVAASIVIAQAQNIENFMVLCGHKLIPPAMKILLEAEETKIDGFLCPGHVSAIIGSKAYEFIADDYNVPCAVAGFEPLDILQGIHLLLSQMQRGSTKVDNEYARVVTSEGNLRAQTLMQEVFDLCSSEWRGMGIIQNSGFSIADGYALHDVQIRFPVEVISSSDAKGCRCGEVLRGLIEPDECSLFGKFCNPTSPLGPCMVSAEGNCNAYYYFAGTYNYNDRYN